MCVPYESYIKGSRKLLAWGGATPTPQEKKNEEKNNTTKYKIPNLMTRDPFFLTFARAERKEMDAAVRFLLFLLSSIYPKK